MKLRHVIPVLMLASCKPTPLPIEPASTAGEHENHGAGEGHEDHGTNTGSPSENTDPTTTPTEGTNPSEPAPPTDPAVPVDPPGSHPTAVVSEFGTEESRHLVVTATALDGLDAPRALAFHPDRPDELWTVNRGFNGTVTFFHAGELGQLADKRSDIVAYHFMDQPTSLAFGANNTFATCGDTRNDHYHAGDDMAGPALWSADLDIYARIYQNYGSGKLGSHIDMLHQSPWCMGIAHDVDNAYWVFDGFNGHIVFYDFHQDHGPGNDDHTDGVVRRYPEAHVTRIREVPGHLVLDHETGWLYVADTGAARIIRLDTHSGAWSRALHPMNEDLAEFSEYAGATVETFVAQGLEQPSGIAIKDGKLFVSDFGTNDIVAFDLADGAELGRMHTGASGVMGITFSSDGHLWFADGVDDEVVRVDP